MQFVVATASRAPTRSAKAASNSRTRGPWETQPVAIDVGDRRALVAAQVRTGERDLHQAARASAAIGCVGGAGALGAPPLDEAGEAFLEVDLGLEAELLARGARVGQPAGDAVDGALRPVLDRAGRSP